jgi:hypothetical protein
VLAVVKPIVGNLQTAVTAAGTLYPSHSVDIKFDGQEIVEDLKVKEGDPLSGVSDCKISLSDFEGKMTFSSENEEQNLAQYLSRYLETVGVSITVTQAREVLDGGDTDDVVLLWKRPKS